MFDGKVRKEKNLKENISRINIEDNVCAACVLFDFVSLWIWDNRDFAFFVFERM